MNNTLLNNVVKYQSIYKSPLGDILITSNDNYLTGLWFVGQKYYPSNIEKEIDKDNEIIKLTKKWLDVYFTKVDPDFKIPVFFNGTKFQNDVWIILSKIPYGKTITYKDIANLIAKKYGIEKMSSQAVGKAVGHNKISIIVPCHRVIGKNGNLTGYASGIDKKRKLLILENVIQE